ncbi:MAG: hypothetical protein ACR2OO_08980 [Thermomicrobiales bacterium]
MSAKEAIHRLVDKLPDEQADDVLAYIRRVTTAPHLDDDRQSRSDEEAQPLEWMNIGEPTSDDDPLWNIIGIVGADVDVPSDLAANHDRYLAEIYDERRQS